MDNLEKLVRSELGNLRMAEVSYTYKDRKGKEQRGVAAAVDVLDEVSNWMAGERIAYAQEPTNATYNDYTYSEYINEIKSGRYGKNHNSNYEKYMIYNK